MNIDEEFLMYEQISTKMSADNRLISNRISPKFPAMFPSKSNGGNLTVEISLEYFRHNIRQHSGKIYAESNGRHLTVCHGVDIALSVCLTIRRKDLWKCWQKLSDELSE